MMAKAFIGGLLGVALGLTLFLAACGSGGGEELTKADFVRKGNAICGKWQQERAKRVGEVSTRFKPPYTSHEKETAILFLLRPYETTIEELKELSPPSGQEKEVGAMIKAMEKGVGRMHANPTAAVNSIKTFQDSNRKAEANGLKECTV